MKAKKSFGQHFLTQDSIAERIADSIVLAEGVGQVLEIGPGMGMLTKFLLKGNYDLKVVEADRDMVAYLKEHYPELNGKIIESDFLKVHLEEEMEGKPFSLIGNFPYNISSQIVIQTIQNRSLIPEMVGMFQLEMAERVAAGPGSKTYGGLSVLTQAYFAVELLFRVKKGSFNPPPKVESAVIRLKRLENPRVSSKEKDFKRVVKMAFSQRRKMLRNTLKSLITDPKMLEDEIFTLRPEALSVERFDYLTNLLYKEK